MGSKSADIRYESLKIEAMELRQQLSTLTSKFELSLDKGLVLEKRLSNLLEDNKTLKLQCMDAEAKRIISEQEAARYLEMLNQKGLNANAKKKVTVSTSCTYLFESFTKEASSELKSESKKTKKPLVNNTNMICIKREELSDLDRSIKELKEALNKKEEIWGKTSEKERNQRMRINHLAVQLRELRRKHDWKASELEYKTRELKYSDDMEDLKENDDDSGCPSADEKKFTIFHFA